MTTAIEQLKARVAQSGISGHGVSRTPEFARIFQLPMRQEVDQKLLAETLTEILKKPTGQLRLWTTQALALWELLKTKGLFAPIAVGRGKALISLLAPTVLEASRPVLLVPAALREQTRGKVLPEMRTHWRISDNLKVIGYSELSLAHRADILEELNPDVLVCDEAHNVKNARAARTKRIARFLKEHPETCVVALSGTMTRKSILDYWHVLHWSLGPRGAPLPGTWHETKSWSLALDEDIPAEKRIAPGALKLLCADGETVREGYQNRLLRTPGVVGSGPEELGTSLVIHRQSRTPVMTRETLQALKKLRATWETPNGDPIFEAVDLWRHAREIGLGFWYRWNPAPPENWRAARKAWKGYVRNMLRHNRRELDSELQVYNACAARGDKAPAEWAQWVAVKDSYRIQVEPVWLSDFAVDAAHLWLRENPRGICWVEHRAFGERIQKKSGYPFFGQGAKASKEILDVTGPIIASTHAHSEGKNLQDRYESNLVVSCPSSGKRWEQMLGRTHRAGQSADQVVVDVWQYTQEQKASFDKALREALYIRQTLGAQQKLLYADII
jgi:hypothetical protein